MVCTAGSALASPLIGNQVDDFFDSVLEQAEHLVSVNRQFPDNGFDLNPVLNIFLNLDGTTLRGPTELKRIGNTEGYQQNDHANANGIVSLGKLDIGFEKFEFGFFGLKFSHPITVTLQDAKAAVTIDRYKNNLSTCQVTVKVEPPSGYYLVHFGMKGGPSKLLSGIFEYALSFALKYIKLPFPTEYNMLFPDITNLLQKELTIAARRISC